MRIAALQEERSREETLQKERHARLLQTEQKNAEVIGMCAIGLYREGSNPQFSWK